MKNYKKVQMVAKNAPSGSYAAGCPSAGHEGNGVKPGWCKKCEMIA